MSWGRLGAVMLGEGGRLGITGDTTCLGAKTAGVVLAMTGWNLGDGCVGVLVLSGVL